MSFVTVCLVLCGSISCSRAQDPVVPVYEEPMHRLVLERLTVRVLDVQVPVGGTSFYHLHSDPIFYVAIDISEIDAQILGEEWKRTKVSAWHTGAVAHDLGHAEEPLIHRIRNVGSETFRLIAVINSTVLFEAARKAGVERVVHVSITNPSLESPLSYFRGKAQVAAALEASGLSYAILRPAVLFGKEDILLNNIAWALRRLPVFGVFGDGSYWVCPIHVEDLADAAVHFGTTRDNLVVEAIGPEKFTYRELVESVGEIIGAPRPVINVPGWLGWLVGRVVGSLHGDVMITRDEIRGLAAGLLHVESKPLGRTSLSKWVRANRDSLGRRYTSEMARRTNRTRAYESN